MSCARLPRLVTIETEERGRRDIVEWFLKIICGVCLCIVCTPESQRPLSPSWCSKPKGVLSSCLLAPPCPALPRSPGIPLVCALIAEAPSEKGGLLSYLFCGMLEEDKPLAAVFQGSPCKHIPSVWLWDSESAHRFQQVCNTDCFFIFALCCRVISKGLGTRNWTLAMDFED